MNNLPCLRKLSLSLALLALCSIALACQPRVMEKTEVESVDPAAAANDNDPDLEDPALGTHPLQDERLGGTLWMQTAAEFPAVSRQAFALARLQLDRALRDRSWTAALEQEPGTFGRKPPAIIVDADETVLDNSPFQEQMLLDGNVPFDEDMWNEWAGMGKAEPMAGAKEFLDYAASRGVEVFYVTNRDTTVEDGTRSNLEAVGFPLSAETDTLLTKNERDDWGSDKRTRRAHVAETHRILLLLGDDLNDFVSGARARDPETRRRLAEENVDKWGEKWIVFPNPVYGSWEASLFGRDYDLQRSENLTKKREYLRGYRDGVEMEPAPRSEPTVDESVAPTPARPAPAYTTPVRPAPADPEPAQPAPVEPEPAPPQPAQADPEPAPTEAEPAEPEPPEPTPSEPETEAEPPEPEETEG